MTYRQRIMKIWKDYCSGTVVEVLKNTGVVTGSKNNKKSNVLLPLLSLDHKIKNPEILFIGLNPSFSSSGFKGILKWGRRKDITEEELCGMSPDTYNEYFENIKFLEENIKFQSKKEVGVLNAVVELEMLSKVKYDTYFKPFRSLAKDVGFDGDEYWEHMDLFYWRTTKSSGIKKALYSSSNSSKYSDLRLFWKKQWELSVALMEDINPKVIVVANAFSSDFIIRHHPGIDRIKGDNQAEHALREGYARIKLDAKSKDTTLIVFSCMLSNGQLDKYGRGRLVKQIKSLLNPLCQDSCRL